MLTLIVAVAENNVIGNDNRLIWHLSEDLKHFKALTMGHPIIMGRKTHQSIGKPLPGRTNIVLTTQRNYKAEGCILAHTLQQAVEAAEAFGGQPFVIGGESIYRQALPLSDTVHLTRIHHAYDGDARFPELPDDEWVEVRREDFDRGQQFAYPFSFIQYQRKNP